MHRRRSTGLAALVLANTVPLLAVQQMVYGVSLRLLLQDCCSWAPATLTCWKSLQAAVGLTLTSRTATRALLRLVSSLSFS